nr:integrase, catalytic region, zinc finger, CCHC-type, peptidase aspartic, catalytic [Tanacetum cinerariifolium]
NENDCHKIEKVCDKEENPKVIAPGMFKLSVSQSVSPISMSKSSCDSKNVEIKLKRKRRETSSASVCNDTMNVSCNPKMCDLLDDNNFFIFDDVNVRISPVSKMPFRKSFIVLICLWIIDSGCSKHMTGNRALLTNFVEKFLGTVRFGNNDFAVIAGYGDVVIGSVMIKKVYYVEGLGHNFFSIG